MAACPYPNTIHTQTQPKMTYTFQPTDLVIYKAALTDDWDSVSQIFADDPQLTLKPIGPRLETPLMVSMGTNRSHYFSDQLRHKIDDELSYNRDPLSATDSEGNTALHYAAKAGNRIDAMAFMLSAPAMASHQNSNGDTPLILAAALGRKDVLQLMLDANTMVDQRGVYSVARGGSLLALTIQGEILDIALQIINAYPDIILEYDWQSKRGLEVLATKPQLFPSGTKLGLWGRLLYSLLPVKKSGVILENKSREDAERESYSRISKVDTQDETFLQYLASPITDIYDIKVKHILAKHLVSRMSTIIMEKADHEIAWNMLGSTIAMAVGYGAYELIEECILAYPTIIWYNFKGFNLFHAAIRQRQEKVYNLVYQMSNHKAFIASQLDDEEKENALHIAAKLAPPHRLNITTGAALQMQRELQWFKEIENFVEPSYKEALNKNGKTPRMLFTDEHKDLLIEGQEWMKGTSSSCTVVAALIITMAFAAAFTVPGGNKDDGKPLFLDKGAFMLFIISDAIALFSSCTSVLLFLGILTSRYAEHDFLYALPKRMTIGLVSLFLSLAATLIAFSATLALVLQDKVTWIAVPLGILTSIPVCLFGLLQFPLLKELVFSTYGPSIFHKQSDRIIY